MITALCEISLNFSRIFSALHWLDWLVIIGFLGLIVFIGLSYTAQAGKDISSFFLGGRNLPWYVAGISMVATTFAADTPLAVTELVGTKGIAGNWLWWNFLLGGMLTTFFFSRLWRRAEVVTEVELIELRYGGMQAAILRGFKSLYLGVFMNVLIIGWVNLAMITILEVFFGMTREEAMVLVAVLLVLIAVYSSLSGLMGVAITDNIQFFVALGGTIILAFLVVGSDAVGGLSGLKEQITATSPQVLDFFPQVSADTEASSVASTFSITIGAFLAYLGVQWWASWYPGSEPGGGGYVAQRMMSAKNEKHSIFATLFFQVAHYCIRPWPWILVGLAAIVLYSGFSTKIQDEALRQEVMALEQQGVKPLDFTKDNKNLQADEELYRMHGPQLMNVNERLTAEAEGNPELRQALDYTADTRKGYVMAMQDFLPVGLKGLLLAAFFAAFMSTISTQLNWGASYVINDFYARFIKKDATQKSLVLMSRLFTVLLMILGLTVTSFMNSISGVWEFIIECGAGLGLVLILRWYWWRINAWSEITATVVPFIVYAVSRFGFGLEFPNSFFVTVGITTMAWLVVTFLTPPTNRKTLNNFYRKIQPDTGWGPIARETAIPQNPTKMVNLVVCWLSGIIFVYSVLFFSGKLLFLEWSEAVWFGISAVASCVILVIFVRKSKIFAD